MTDAAQPLQPVQPVAAAAPAPVAAPAAPAAPAGPVVTIDDFKKFKIVVAQVKEVKAHPNADKLYLLQVDTGSDVRQIVAGIRHAYTPEQLVGRKVIMIANLAPATIRGEVSNGMLFAASDDVTTALLAPEKDVKIGAGVK